MKCASLSWGEFKSRHERSETYKRPTYLVVLTIQCNDDFLKSGRYWRGYKRMAIEQVHDETCAFRRGAPITHHHSRHVTESLWKRLKMKLLLHNLFVISYHHLSACIWKSVMPLRLYLMCIVFRLRLCDDFWRSRSRWLSASTCSRRILRRRWFKTLHYTWVVG